MTQSRGVSLELIEQISKDKEEPKWMLEYRKRCFDVYIKAELPTWAPKALNSFDFNKLNYYIPPDTEIHRTWEDVPEEIREKYDKLGIPEGERKYLAGMGAQFESEMIYHSIKEELEDKGIIFEAMSEAVKKHPDLVKEYFGKLVPPENNKFAALNGAVWSGGSFIYIPPGVYNTLPLHNFFQMNLSSQGQFERTIIIADENSRVEFLEGCVAPLYSETSVHAGVVEIFAKKGSEIKFSTMQNWSKNVWNLVTKRAKVDEDASIYWVDGNVGSGISMKYPTVLLAGEGASGRILSLSFVSDGQIVDSGGKAMHLAENTKSVVESRAVIKKMGTSIYRGGVFVSPAAQNSKASVECTSLLLEEGGETRSLPNIKVENGNSSVDHEANLLKIGRDQLNYLMSRGLSESDARSMIIAGFIDPFTNELPMEYAVEFNRLVELELFSE